MHVCLSAGLLRPGTVLYQLVDSNLSFLLAKSGQGLRWQKYPALLSWLTSMAWQGGGACIELMRGPGWSGQVVQGCV